jgi:phosphoglycerate dehydrogenase-like enzyme
VRREQKQVTLTTHIGGVAQETHVEFERLVMENTERFLLDEQPLLTVRSGILFLFAVRSY